MGLEETAQGQGTHRSVASRHHLSTQKMYELRTKLRCSSEGRPRVGQGGAGWGRPWGQDEGTSGSPVPPRRRGEPGHSQLPPLV